jgi:hypothetical protein
VREVEGAVGELNDGGGDGGEGAFEGGDEVGFRWDVAECVCGVGDAEVCLVIKLDLNSGSMGKGSYRSSHYSL